MRRRHKKWDLRVVFLYYVLMGEVTLTGLCYAQSQWLGFGFA